MEKGRIKHVSTYGMNEARREESMRLNMWCKHVGGENL